MIDMATRKRASTKLVARQPVVPVARITTADATASSIYLPSTQSSVTEGVSTGSSLDLLLRVSAQDASGAFNVAIAPTNYVLQAIANAWQSRHHQEIATLVNVVNWQHGMLDYNARYNAYLLEQISQEEFESASQELAYEPVELQPQDLIEKIRTVLSLTGIDYTPSDFASLFRCREDVVHSALKLMADQ